MTETFVEPPATRAGETSVGRPYPRRDGPSKTVGDAAYSADQRPDGLVHAVPVLATVPRALATVDARAAEAVLGVLAVLTPENAPRTHPVPPGAVLPSMLATTVAYLQDGEVFWNGQPVAVVVATTLEVARHAAALVTVAYEARPADTDFVGRLDTAYPEPGSPIAVTLLEKGSPEQALGEAAARVDALYTTARYNHNAMETHSTTARWDGERLVLHDGSQFIAGYQPVLAALFALPETGVEVHSTVVGGAFGGKTMVWANSVLAALAARAVGRPVRLAMTREGVYRTVGGRTPSRQRVALGASADGRLASIVHSSVCTQSRVGGLAEAVVAASSTMYDAPNLLFEQRLVDLDIVPNTSMRAPGESIGSFALESAVDELAAELGMDPIELRVRNDPAVAPADGRTYSSRKVVECLRRGRAEFRWDERRAGSHRRGRLLVGTGVAAALHPAARFAADVEIELTAAGIATVRCGFHEMGMGGATTQAAIAADALGLPAGAVAVEHGRSTLPLGPNAGGSAQTATAAAGVLDAARELTATLLALAPPSSPLAGAAPEDVTAQRSGLWHTADPGRGATYRDLLAAAGRERVTVRVGSSDPADFEMRSVMAFVGMRDTVKAAYGAQFCEVTVDVDTGEVRVTDWLGVFHIGRVVNPLLAASQIRGGVVMGIGMALMEETLEDPASGRIVNPSLTDYHVPVQADVPSIGVRFLDEPDPEMPAGVLGAGEVGIVGAAAAIANAVQHATGRRLRSLPITPEAVVG